ncbi:MAG TPA: hypothetical protein VF773_13415 [Verrucomicrobiae bacterium]
METFRNLATLFKAVRPLVLLAVYWCLPAEAADVQVAVKNTYYPRNALVWVTKNGAQIPGFPQKSVAFGQFSTPWTISSVSVGDEIRVEWRPESSSNVPNQVGYMLDGTGQTYTVPSGLSGTVSVQWRTTNPDWFDAKPAFVNTSAGVLNDVQFHYEPKETNTWSLVQSFTENNVQPNTVRRFTEYNNWDSSFLPGSKMKYTWKDATGARRDAILVGSVTNGTFIVPAGSGSGEQEVQWEPTFEVTVRYRDNNVDCRGSHARIWGSTDNGATWEQVWEFAGPTPYTKSWTGTKAVWVRKNTIFKATYVVKDADYSSGGAEAAFNDPSKVTQCLLSTGASFYAASTGGASEMPAGLYFEGNTELPICSGRMISERDAIDYVNYPRTEIKLLVPGATSPNVTWAVLGNGAALEVDPTGVSYSGGVFFTATLQATELHPLDDKVTVRAIVTGTGATDCCSTQIVTLDIGLGCGGEEGTCASCEAQGFGAPLVKNENGPHLSWNLGLHDEEATSGVLQLATEANSTTLPAFKVSSRSARVTRYPADESQALQWVKTPQGLARVNSINSSKRELSFYSNDQINFSGTIWQPNGTATPLRKWTIESTGGGNTFTLSETAGQVFQYKYGSSKWALTYPNSGVNRTNVSWKSGNEYYTEITETQNSASVMVAKSRQEFVYINGQRYLKVREEGDTANGGSRTTTYSPVTSGNGVGRPSRIEYWDGRWEIFKYDTFGRVIEHHQSYLDIAPPTAPNFPAAGQSRVTFYDYDWVPSGTSTQDAATFRAYWKNLARTEVVNVPNAAQDAWVEVSRVYRHTPSLEEVQEERCVDPGSAFGDSSNLRTKTIRYPFSDSNHGKIKYVFHENGTATKFSYSSDLNGTKTIEETGEPSSLVDGATIVNGTRTELVRDTLGRTVSRISKPIVSGSATSVVLSRELYGYGVGNDMNDYNVTNLANRVTKYRHNCCALSTLEDGDGVVTTYLYDGIKRRYGEIKTYGTDDIQFINTLDAAGRVLQAKRIGEGSDGSQVSSSLTLTMTLGTEPTPGITKTNIRSERCRRW